MIRENLLIAQFQVKYQTKWLLVKIKPKLSKTLIVHEALKQTPNVKEIVNKIDTQTKLSFSKDKCRLRNTIN